MLQHKNETLEENEKIIIYFLVKNESDEKHGNKHNKYRIISEPLETTFKKNFEFEFDDKNKIVFNRFLDNLTENMFIILNKKQMKVYEIKYLSQYENYYFNDGYYIVSDYVYKGDMIYINNINDEADIMLNIEQIEGSN